MRDCLNQWKVFLLGAGAAASILGVGLVTPAEARRVTSGQRSHHVIHKAEVGASSRSAVRMQRKRHARNVAAGERSVQRRRYARHHRHDARYAVEFSATAYGEALNLDRAVINRRTGSAWGRRDVASAGPGRTPTTGSTGFGEGSVVSEARRWLGTNPTRRRTLWCGAFMNFVLERTGHRGTGSDLARSFASLGHRVSGPRVGAIAVMARRGGGHVGVVSGIDSRGNPIIISGNHSHTVAESVYPLRRIYAYVMPN